MCKKGKKAEVGIYLDQNPGLINCLNGEPLRLAAQGNNISVLRMLVGIKDVQVNMKGGFILSVLGFYNNELRSRMSVS